MRFLCTLSCLLVIVAAHAAEWRNDLFGVSANLPETAGWQPIEAPNSASVTVLVAMQHPQKQAVFGINVIHDLPTANLRDPKTIATVEQTLRSLGYQFFGRANVNVGGREWVQFPVRGATPPTSGLIRYTSANNQVYVVSLLRGGGAEAAQDPELQAAGASVRIAGGQAAPPTVAAVPPAPVAPSAPVVAVAPPNPATPAAPAVQADDKDSDDAPVKIGPVTVTRKQLRLGGLGLAGVIVLLILMKLIGGGGNDRAPTKRP